MTTHAPHIPIFPPMMKTLTADQALMMEPEQILEELQVEMDRTLKITLVRSLRASEATAKTKRSLLKQ